MPWLALTVLITLLLLLGLCGALWVYRRQWARGLQEAAEVNARLQSSLDAQTQALQQQAAQWQDAVTLRDERAACLQADLLGSAATVAEAARTLRLHELPPALREQAELVDGSIQCLRASLALQVDSARVEAGTLALMPAVFDFDAVLQAFGDAASVQAGAYERELIFEVEPDVPRWLLGDAPRLLSLLKAQLDWMLGNLVGGDVLVHVGFDQPRVGLPSPEPGMSLLLRFEISAGTGFGRRTRVDAQDARARLAAAVHLRLLELMGGSAGQREAPGLGPVQWFTAQVQTADARDSMDESGSRPALSGRRVLVVDDKEGVRTLLTKLLGHWGLIVTAAASGFAAIQAAVSAENMGKGFDLVMLDAEMPELNGLETARLLNARGLHEVPILVLLSGTLTGPLLAEAQLAGVAEVLGKPLVRQAVHQMLQRMLACAGSTAAAAPKVQREAGIPAAVQALSGARVLLVEDNEINQQIALELLQASGMEVQVAGHGQAALELLNWQYFDLVLMDLQMPVFDGLAATRLIRANPRHAALPVIAMTAAASPLVRQQCIEGGMNAHLIKPFDLDSLWAVLQRWIAPRPGLGQGRQDPPASEPARDSTQAPALLQLPPSFPGFDMQAALQRMGNRVDLYVRTARMFLDTQADSVELVREALNMGDRETAIRLATTLKNLAGNLGARSLQDEALALEACLREPADVEFRGRAIRVEEALEIVCLAIRSILVSATAKPLPQQASAPAVGSSP
ncbi:MAG TPA: response regulator [Burkholderiaceae bacterium]|jgi:two-component system sensor histidine kinase/response regulator